MQGQERAHARRRERGFGEETRGIGQAFIEKAVDPAAVAEFIEDMRK